MGPRANTKSGALQYGLCEGGFGGTPPGNLHALNCVSGVPEALSCMHMVHIYLQVVVFDERFQIEKYIGALASGLRSSHVTQF